MMNNKADETKADEASPVNFDKGRLGGTKSGRRKYRWLPLVLVLLITFSITLILLRRHLLPLYQIISVYLVWPFRAPPHLWTPPPVLRGNISPLYAHEQRLAEIPRILHHVLLGPLAANPPTDWIAARNSCLALHPSYTAHFWTDDNAATLIDTHYPHLRPTYDSYTSIVQRADAFRYIIMHHFGGVFVDMDLVCLSSLEPIINILEHEHEDILLAPQAHPVGVSNGFIIATAHHPVLRRALYYIPHFNLNFILAYVTVMFSTGACFSRPCFKIQILGILSASWPAERIC